MALSMGQILKGQKGVYRLVELLKAPTVFKAQILQDSHIKPGLYGSTNTLRSLD